MQRVFEILDELIETIESAKGVPMSSSVIVNRPALLDHLDDLRDAFPQALEDAREILEQRDDIIESAREEAERVRQISTTEAQRLQQESTAEVDRLRTESRSEADRLVAEARQRAEQSVAAATAEAERVVQAANAEATARVQTAGAEADAIRVNARAEHERLVSAHEIHQGAVRSADDITKAAHAKSSKLADDADRYVEDSLASLSETIQKLQRTVDAGRGQVRTRRGSGPTADTVYDQNR